jgi:prepilin-type N-terminal cleavage/methylation domain-containing protein
MSSPLVRCAGRQSRPSSAGFTLIEVLVATSLTLILMGAVVAMFGNLGDSIAESRSTLEMTDRLRSVAMMLQRDLQGLTVKTIPPQNPNTAAGDLEIIEGPIGTTGNMLQPFAVAVDLDTGAATPDATPTDWDDVLLFTSRRASQPFVGRCAGTADGTLKSDLAEIAWFLRGTTLYRRVLLIAPAAPINAGGAAGFYNLNDVSVRMQNNQLVANSLGDLTKRENRFAHNNQAYPFDVRGWGQLGLPTLCECSSPSWTACRMPPTAPGAINQIDFWRNPFPWNGCDPKTGNMLQGPRVAEDVILTNVIGFDVKLWDPGVNDYRDLGYNPNQGRFTATAPWPLFHHYGNPASGLSATANAARIWDSWSTHYETEGRGPNDSAAGRSTNGLDDDGNGAVDDPLEQIAPPPYPGPLRAIQVKIRCFDPDSRQIRDVTVVQEFLPK